MASRFSLLIPPAFPWRATTSKLETAATKPLSWPEYEANDQLANKLTSDSSATSVPIASDQAKACNSTEKNDNKTDLVSAAEPVKEKATNEPVGTSKQDAKLERSAESGPADVTKEPEVVESKPMVSGELLDKLLAKLKFVDNLLARLQAIKRRAANSTLTNDVVGGEDLDPSYGFDLSESELNEPDQELNGARQLGSRRLSLNYLNARKRP